MGVGQRRVGAGSHNRIERGLFGAQNFHLELDFRGDVEFGDARPKSLEYPSIRLRVYLHTFPDLDNLISRFEHSPLLDDPANGVE